MFSGSAFHCWTILLEKKYFLKSKLGLEVTLQRDCSLFLVYTKYKYRFKNDFLKHNIKSTTGKHNIKSATGKNQINSEYFKFTLLNNYPYFQDTL